MIHGIHGFIRPRLVRLGKIHLGEKVAKNGKEFPTDLLHFRVPPEVAEVYGEEPRALDVRVPSADISEWFPYSLKRYSRDGKLWCRGDGQIARCYDEATGEWAEKPCLYKDCEFYQGRKCTEIGTLQVILPHVDMTGVYQISTGSWHAINNVHQEFGTLLDIMRGAVGPVADVAILHLTMQLTREEEPLEYTDGGKRKTTRKAVLHMRPPRMTQQMVEELAARCANRAVKYLTPGPGAEDVPDDVDYGDEEPIEGEVVPDTDEIIEGEVVPEPDESMPADLYPGAAPAGADMGARTAWAALIEQAQALGKASGAVEKSVVTGVDKDAKTFADLSAADADKAISRLTDMVQAWQDEAPNDKPQEGLSF
jgi:hypothetical protein